jgi:MFS family permease
MIEVRWVATAYLLAVVSLIPIIGRIGEIRGRRTFYVAGYALFGLASLLCGLSPDLRSLIAFRALDRSVSDGHSCGCPFGSPQDR